MPVYNCARYLKQSVKSILNQTYKDFEFLIINDGSTDNAEEIISGFKDSRINYKKIEHKGTSAALNYGINTASGNWIARIDTDDLNVPARLEKQAAFISGNPDYDIISSWSVYFKEPHRILFFLKEPVEHPDIHKYLNLHNPINSSSVIYRKNVIKKAKYNENFDTYEDFELFFRIRDEVKFYNIPEFLSYTRMRVGSRTRVGSKQDIYNVINDYALKQLINSTRKRDQFYWATTIAWQKFFYGNRKNSRSYLKRIPDLKNISALLATYLPENLFRKLIDGRIKYRVQDLLTSKQYFKKELKELLS
jgi:glycosyltransferase involved in cell wall biosynthesis